ncbi:VCBS repeat-containing protein [Chryseolinea sp. T2]|uniref:VCBS repeat-containing protein n=1 Tax=Chryseolinea sp. T2 TaxID=3129255 RepID=UPI00307892AC
MKRAYWIVFSNVLFALLPFGSYGQSTLFEALPAQKTGVQFKNLLNETPKSNVLTYEYFYNGGGAAIGDFNNDGLDDIYFTGNMKPNALYVNQGNFRFKEVAAAAGVDCPKGWKTGVALADVNGDGFLDIYVCYSGKGDPELRRNKLFLNNGNLTFREAAATVGLDDPGYSTHASFFDYDRDGDLDMYLLNHNVVVIREFEYANAKKERHPYAGHKLYRNDNGKFVDVSEAAGIKGNPLGFGLGITAADINKDGWIDLYVSNDYVEPDYMYINNGDGTFTDRMTEYVQHISYFSMGCDISDINNDGLADIFTVDMLPEDNRRQKLLYGPENYEHYALMVMNGFYFQNMRNMLHLNNGNGTYSEIGQYAGISKTDWSWAPLFGDYDNDGWKDLFITNGYYRDYTNRDFLKYKGDYYFQMAKERQKADTFHLVTSMTSTPIHNYMYRNNGDLTFADNSTEWGFAEKNFSSGAAYGDLDNDGDLDLVINHQNETASVFRNQLRERNSNAHYLQITLTGNGQNSQGIGTQITAWVTGKQQYFEKTSSHGFQSSIAGRVHIGLGNSQLVDSLIVRWPDGNIQRLTNIKVDQLLNIKYEIAPGKTTPPAAAVSGSKLFTHVDPIISYEHIEEGYNDFKRQPLLMSMLTTCGPVLAGGDVNGDKRIDVFVGGAQGKTGEIFLQGEQGRFTASTSKGMFDIINNDADAAFADIDNDGDLDLYVVSGGYNEYEESDKALQDRLYLNDGRGNFSAAKNWLPLMQTSKSCVAPFDYDHDGQIDLFVGGRVVPGKYPQSPMSFLLHNEKSRLESKPNLLPDMGLLGMVTDAIWSDVDGDSWEDLIVIGEFMNIEVLGNKAGKSFESITSKVFDKPLPGLWNTIIAQDFDKDGDQDFIVGNFGLNSQLRASEKQPVSLVYKDFDNNGSIDPMLTHYIQGVAYPFASRDELLDQFYGMRPKFTTYKSYADARLEDIFSASDLKSAKVLKTTTLESIYLENKAGKLVPHSLPAQAQFSPLYAISVADVDHDGNMDFIAAGNQSSIRIRMGVIDANFGQVFKGDGKGNFQYVKQPESGLVITGDVKSTKIIMVAGHEYLLVGVNNVGIDCYELNK